MSLFGSILKTGFDVVTSPVEMVKDAATLGGVLTDQDEPYSIQRAKRLSDDLEDVHDELDDL